MEKPATAASGHKVPGSIAQVGVVLRYSFLDYLRSRRFVILLTITFIISGILTGVVGYYRPAGFIGSPLSFLSGWWGMSVTFITVLSGIFFGGDAISGEFQNKTGYFTLPNPIRRSSVYIGKWLSAFIAASIILAIFTVITLANETFYFPGVSIPWQFGESFLFAWFYLVAVLGFTFFFSSFFKSTSYSILVTAILFLFAFTLIQTLVSALAQVEPWFILTYGSQIIGNVLSTTYPDHISQTAGFGPGGRAGAPTFTTFNVTVPEGLAIIAVYFLVTAALGLILFERKEFN
jgi:ABC-2 type transport system permease protein